MISHKPPVQASSAKLLMGQSVTPMAFVRGMARALSKSLLPLNAWLEKAQITPDQLEQPLATITAAQMEVASEWAMRALNDEALGWFERALPWGSYGMLARASMGANNLGIAMRRWSRHHGLLTSLVALHITTRPDALIDITITDLGVDPRLQEFCHVTLLRNMLGFASWAVDSRLSLHSASFGFTEPAHAAAYDVLFQCPVTFGASHTGMTLASNYLELPLRRDELALNTMLQRALPLTVRHYRRDRLLVQQVQQLLGSDRPAPTADDLANQLNMSTRSLYRQLQVEGASWQQLKTQHAMTLARLALLTHNWPIKQVASHCGFANEKSFIRAFRQHTGHSPAAFRQRK
ncbi:MAG: AraC-like DNA-binding protein [Burkholderiaceae bacterium]|jgi:AraC-like DNA-binding protein